MAATALTENLTLLRPTEAHASAFLEMVHEYRQTGDTRFDTLFGSDGQPDLAAYLARLERMEHGLDLTPTQVPQSTFWLLRDGGYPLGTSRLRHRLNETLERVGGHIGYDIRPSQRRKGYGKAILALTLHEARTFGLARVLLTCAADNVGSARIIELNGGVFEGVAFAADGTKILRFWIDLA